MPERSFHPIAAESEEDCHPSVKKIRTQYDSSFTLFTV